MTSHPLTCLLFRRITPAAFVGLFAACITLLLVGCGATSPYSPTYRQKQSANARAQRLSRAGFEPASTARALQDIWHGLTIVVAEATGSQLPPPNMVAVFAKDAPRFRTLALPLINESSQPIDTAAFDRMLLREMETTNPNNRRWVLVKSDSSEIATPEPDADYILRITLHDLPNDLQPAPNELVYMWEILDAKTQAGVLWGGERIVIPPPHQ